MGHLPLRRGHWVESRRRRRLRDRIELRRGSHHQQRPGSWFLDGQCLVPNGLHVDPIDSPGTPRASPATLRTTGTTPTGHGAPSPSPTRADGLRANPSPPAVTWGLPLAYGRDGLDDCPRPVSMPREPSEGDDLHQDGDPDAVGWFGVLYGCFPGAACIVRSRACPGARRRSLPSSCTSRPTFGSRCSS